MSNEVNPPPPPFDQLLRARRALTEFGFGAIDQQVIHLRSAPVVVHFLSHQHQHIVMITLRPLHPQIVISHHNEIEPGLRRGLRDLIVIPRPIRIGRVHMEVADDFVCHGSLE
jgi:hypothetical protein